MNVIILAENHRNSLGLIRSIGECGYRVILLLKKSDVNFVSKSRYVSEVHYLRNCDEILMLVKTISHDIDRPILISSTEEYADYVDSHIDELRKYCFTEGGAKNGAIQPYREKSIAQKLASEVGFRLPENWLVYDRDEIPENLCFPVLVKADKSIDDWKNVMKICNTKDEFINHIQSLPTKFFPLQVQEFIEKEYEMFFCGCSLDGGKTIVAPVGQKKERNYPNTYGLVSYSKSIEITNDKNVQLLVDKTQKFLQYIGYTGLFSTEFIYAKGEYYFLEINLRNDSTSILSTRCGCNLPAILCDYMTGKDWNQHIHEYKPRHFMYIVSDVHFVLRGKVSVFKWLKELYQAGAYSYFDRKDCKPFVYYIWSLIKSKI